MKQETFLQQAEAYGIVPDRLGIYVGKNTGVPFAVYIYREDANWIVCENEDRNNRYIRYTGEEDAAFDLAWNILSVRLQLEKYVTAAIPKSLIFTDRSVVFAFMEEKYQMHGAALEQAWEYLKQDLHVLNEVKYFAVNGAFVPEKYCYSVQGYTAQQLYETTYLDALGAFNYLVYLKRKPKEALADLKAGLPRR